MNKNDNTKKNISFELYIFFIYLDKFCLKLNVRRKDFVEESI